MLKENTTAPHERIRRAIVSLIENNTSWPGKTTWTKEIGTAVALSVHPWPDKPVSDSILNIIATEMLPGTNFQHENPYEIGIDRLLRIAEALQHTSESNLSIQYTNAANIMQELVALKSDSNESPIQPFPVLDNLIVNPFGTTIPQAISPDFVDINSENSLTEIPSFLKLESLDAIRETFANIQGTAEVCGSSDIGVIHSGKPTGITYHQIAKGLGIRLTFDAFDDQIEALSPRECDILLSRKYTLKTPMILDVVAQRWGVTRERIRQLEKPLTLKFQEEFKKPMALIGGPLLKKYFGTIIRINSLYSKALSITSKSKFREAAAASILDALGPWRDLDGWAVHSSIQTRLDRLSKDLENVADGYGLIRNESLDRVLEGLFDDIMLRDKFLVEVIGVGRTRNFWTIKNSLRCKIAAALSFLGSASTRDEIADLLNESPDRVGSVLGSMNDIVRSDRVRWNFAEMVEDVYDGIVGEIRQYIEEYCGAVPIKVLLEELPNRCDVAESSVKAYLASDAFVVEDKILRLANIDDFSPRSPDSPPGAVNINGEWGQQVRLSDRHFNGYSLAVSFDIAHANGLIPGDDLLVPVDGYNYKVSLIWRSHSINRTIDVGRVADLLKSSKYCANDEIILIPTRNSLKILDKCDYPDGSITSNEFDSTDVVADFMEQQVSDPLLDLLGDDL